MPLPLDCPNLHKIFSSSEILVKFNNLDIFPMVVTNNAAVTELSYCTSHKPKHGLNACAIHN
ncbi:unnamed protein product, partial [Rotaria sp. Silwood2]